MVITWSQLLTELPDLKSLRVGGTALEPLLGALCPPDDDNLAGLHMGPPHPPHTNPVATILGVGSGAGCRRIHIFLPFFPVRFQVFGKLQPVSNPKSPREIIDLHTL
jgi:hypothetical protein